VRAAVLVAAVWVALQLLWAARSILVLAFLGVLFGITLTGGVSWLERRGVPRILGTLGLVLAFFGVLVGLGLLIAPRVGEQVQEIQQQLPDAVRQAEQWLHGQHGWVEQIVGPISGGQATQGTSAGPRETLAQRVAGLAGHFFTIFSSVAGAVGSAVVIVFLAVFVAVEPRTYRRGIMHLVPHRARPKAAQVMDAMGVSMRRWLVAQLIGMLVIGACSTVALLLLDVRAPIALGVIAGFLEFVPYFGPILSAVPAIAMAFLDSPEKVLWVIVAYIAIQQIESNLLMPILMKEGLDLPPALTIVWQAAMALVFGIVGLLIAVPLLGAVMVPIKLLYVEDVVGDEVALPGGG
jgi:predicted PurR-regulated permease PerM